MNFLIKFGIDIKNQNHRKRLIMGLVLVVFIIIMIFRFVSPGSGGQEAGDISYASSEASGNDIQTGVSEESQGEYTNTGNTDIYVDVSGAVNIPCVVCLPQGSRVVDAIEAAGGLRNDADSRYINQAAPLSDGEKVYVPNEDEVAAGIIPDNAAYSGGSGVNATGGQSMPGSVQNGKLNINTANQQELQQLSGIGPALSQRIIDYRESHGKFNSIDEIKNVSGIGEKTFEKFKDVITV